MRDGILVINAGSSSIKFSLFIRHRDHEPELSCSGQVEGITAHPHFMVHAQGGDILAEKQWEQGAVTHDQVLGHLIDWVETHLGDVRLALAGHRVVHGGSHYAKPMRVTPELIIELESLIPLAPLHQPHNLAAIKTIAKLHPGLPQVVCFDTAFHRTNPWITQTFALPYALSEEGVKRYGFHGLSYQYIARKLAQLDPRLSQGRVIAAHLGSGASLCALKEGQSYASTMGFTALEGLMMSTRPGQLDAGVVLYLMEHKKMTAPEIETLLYKQSGLLGVSGISPDLRDLIDNEAPRAVQAVSLFVHRICREIGSLTAALQGLDGLVFTAGIGEHSPQIRQRVCDQLAWLGVRLDQAANLNTQSGVISHSESSVKVLVLPTNEELMIALSVQE